MRSRRRYVGQWVRYDGTGGDGVPSPERSQQAARRGCALPYVRQKGFWMSLQTRILRYLKDQADFPLVPSHRRFIRGAFDPAIQLAAYSAPRGSAKTWLTSQLIACALRPRSPLFQAGIETLAISASLEQSRILVGFVRAILEPLGGYIFIDSSQRLQVKHPASNTRFRVLSSSGKRALGLSQFSAVYADEPSAYEVRNGELVWNALRTSLGKRPGQKLILTGTKSPAEPDSWWPKVLEMGSGPGRYVQVHDAPSSAAWDAWPTIRAANPLILANADLRKTILRERDEGRLDERAARAFRAFRLNRMEDVAREVLISVADWKAVEARPVPPRAGRPIAAFDCGESRSWTGCVVLWQNGRCEAYGLCPGRPGLAFRERQDAQPAGLYQALRDDGVLLIDQDRRMARPKLMVRHLAKLGIHPRIAYADRFKINDLRDAAGGRYSVVERRTRWSESTADIVALRRLALDGNLSIAPASRRLLRMSLSKATVRADEENMRLEKSNGMRARDDIAQSLILGAGALERLGRVPKRSWRALGKVG